MKPEEVVKQIVKGINVYHAEIGKYIQDLENYHKDREKCKKVTAELIWIVMKVSEPKRKDGQTGFHISRKGFREIVKAHDKYAVDVERPNHLEPPLEPILKF